MKKKKNFFSLYLQGIVSVVAVILLVMYFVDHQYLSFLIMCLGIDLMIMGCNNLLFYNRKNLTVFYFFFGVVVFIYGILKMLRVGI